MSKKGKIRIKSESAYFDFILQASGHLYGRIDGLCGFYNGKQEDDRRKPDGSQALSTEEFGDSWEHKDTLETCRNPTCPLNIQEEAYNICSFIRYIIISQIY